MRISDWSSDVCSSDLAINYNRGLRVQAFLAFAPTGDLRFQRAWTWILSKSEKKSWGLPTRILPQPSKSTFPQCPNCLAADRKSVVKGKRVSVRVDLGGSRIIKKKKRQSVV